MISTEQQLETETGFVDAAGQRVRYRVDGGGPPLIMVHGIGAPLELWRPLESRLDGFRTITFDLPGAGRSSTPRGLFGMRQHAAVIETLLDHLEIDSANILGLSLGGMISQEFAHRYPERVERVVLASTSCGWGSTPGNPLAMAVIATPARYYSRRHFKHVAPTLYGPGINKDPELLEEQMEIRQQFKPSVLGYFVQLGAAWTWSSLPWLRTLEIPVLAITGSDDPIVPAVNSHRIASAVQDGRLEIILGGGHLCVIEEAAQAAALIEEFLTSS